MKILNFKPENASYFEKLNKAWIEEYYTLEPQDISVLENPEEGILKNGGRILFVEHHGQIIGTAALKQLEPGIMELTKMAVDVTARGIGAGKFICKNAISEARRLGAKKIILYSNTRQSAAINLYRQLGFTELPVEPGVYDRANIKMGLSL